MAWNKPTSNTVDATSSLRPSGRGKMPRLRLIIAGAAVVVALGALCLYLFTNGEADSRPLQKKDRGLIKEVKPAKAPTNKVEVVEKKKRLRTWEYPESMTNRLSAVERRRWRDAHSPPPAYTNDSARRAEKPWYYVFNYRSENEIATLLTTEPGENLVGMPVYSRKITDDFLKSCTEPIIVAQDDPPEIAELKRAVREAKIDIKARIDSGEDLGDILISSREEAQRLAEYKQILEKDVTDIIKETATTEADFDDAVAAANKMLEQKGIAPLQLNAITKHRFLMKLKKRGKKE